MAGIRLNLKKSYGSGKVSQARQIVTALTNHAESTSSPT